MRIFHSLIRGRRDRMWLSDRPLREKVCSRSTMNLQKVNLDHVPVSIPKHFLPHLNTLRSHLCKAFCARVNVNGVQRTKEDYIRQQVDGVFTSNTFESLLVNVEQLRSKLLQMGCFRDVTVVIDSARGEHRKSSLLLQHSIESVLSML